MSDRDEYMKRQDADHDLIRDRNLATSCSTDYEAWLRALAAKGGKGVVNNIDARSLKRVAELLARYKDTIGKLRDAKEALEELEM